MNLSLILFLIGILGFVLNRKNIILMLISIEIMLLAITFLILVSSLSFDDILGQTYAIYIIAIAGAESAIGLGILVAFYRFNSFINSTCLSYTYISSSKKQVSSCTFTHPLLSTIGSNKRNARSYSTRASYKGSTLKSVPTSKSGSPNLNKNETKSSNKSLVNEKMNTRVLGLKGNTLHPLFVTGLFDAESSFVVMLLKNSSYKTG